MLVEGDGLPKKRIPIVDALLASNSTTSTPPTPTPWSSFSSTLDGLGIDMRATTLSEDDDKVATLCEILQALVELRWYNLNVVLMMDKFVLSESREQMIYSSSSSSSSSSSDNDSGSKSDTTMCVRAFNLGRLEQLLLIYRNIPDPHVSPSPFTLGRRLLQKARSKIEDFFQHMG